MQLRLVADTVRTHRMGIALWIVLGAVTQVTVAAMLAREFSTTPGGAAALAPSVEAAAAAMRVLRWPAERLDTLGGYITYHNILLIPLALGLYGASMGAQALRGGESSGSLEHLLATGRSRTSVLLDRVLGFLVMLTLITAGISAGTAVGLGIGGASNLAGAAVSIGEAALCALPFYALALLVSQFVRSSRAAVGITALAMTAIYVFTNVADQMGPLAAARFLSPFFYFQQSRVLVPGHGFDPLATLALVVMAALPLLAAGLVFVRRDYASTPWRLRSREAARPGGLSRRRPWLATYASASLARQWIGLLGWVGGTALFAALVAYLEPQVRDLWDRITFIQQFLAVTGASSVTDQYLAFAGEMLAPVVGAYAVTQVAAWIAELKQGRVEQILAAPVSWTRLVVERLLTLVGGSLLIAGGAIGGLLLGAAAVDVGLRADGLVRLAGQAVLFGLALGAVGAALAAWLRSGLAPALLAAFLLVSYLVDLLGPAFDWPRWVAQLSVFEAFGRPYLAIPPAASSTLLASLAIGGAALAAWLSQRSPKVA